MRTRTIVTALAVGALVVTPALAFAQQSGNRTGNGTEAKERAQVERVQRDIDRDRVQDRTIAPEGAKQAEHNIYGYDLMSDEERDAYRERIRNASNDQEKEKLMAQHREEIQTRARNRNIKIDANGNPVPED